MAAFSDFHFNFTKKKFTDLLKHSSVISTNELTSKMDSDAIDYFCGYIDLCIQDMCAGFKHVPTKITSNDVYEWISAVEDGKKKTSFFSFDPRTVQKDNNTSM